MEGPALAVILFAAPVLQGTMGLLSQALVFSACLLPAAWAVLRGQAGRPFSGPVVPLAAAAALSGISRAFSPVGALTGTEWLALPAAAAVFVLAEGRPSRAPLLGLRAGGWAVALLALYQAFWLRSGEISSSLVNPNALAFYTLVSWPFAFAMKDYALCAALGIALVWTGSAGAAAAVLGASGAYAAWRARSGGLRGAALFFVPALAGVALTFMLVDPASVADRLRWWGEAWALFAERPLAGWGWGGFTFAAAPAVSGLRTLYAHNHYLEFLAENGLPAFACWAWFLYAAFRRASGARRWALGLGLLHSAVDFGLSLPANLVVFCFAAALPSEGMRETAPARPHPAAALALISLLGFGAAWHRTRLSAARLEAAALDLGRSGSPQGAAALLYGGLQGLPGRPLPQLYSLLGSLELASAGKTADRGRLAAAAAALETAMRGSPRDPRLYGALEKIYSALGDAKSLAWLAERKRLAMGEPG